MSLLIIKQQFQIRDDDRSGIEDTNTVPFAIECHIWAYGALAEVHPHFIIMIASRKADCALFVVQLDQDLIALPEAPAHIPVPARCALLPISVAQRNGITAGIAILPDNVAAAIDTRLVVGVLLDNVGMAHAHPDVGMVQVILADQYTKFEVVLSEGWAHHCSQVDLIQVMVWVRASCTQVAVVSEIRSMSALCCFYRNRKQVRSTRSSVTDETLLYYYSNWFNFYLKDQQTFLALSSILSVITPDCLSISPSQNFMPFSCIFLHSAKSLEVNLFSSGMPPILTWLSHCTSFLTLAMQSSTLFSCSLMVLSTVMRNLDQPSSKLVIKFSLSLISLMGSTFSIHCRRFCSSGF